MSCEAFERRSTDAHLAALTNPDDRHVVVERDGAPVVHAPARYRGGVDAAVDGKPRNTGNVSVSTASSATSRTPAVPRDPAVSGAARRVRVHGTTSTGILARQDTTESAAGRVSASRRVVVCRPATVRWRCRRRDRARRRKHA
jgi:hypothetical protein